MEVVPNAPKRASALGERPGELELFLDTLFAPSIHKEAMACTCFNMHYKNGPRPKSGSVLFCEISELEMSINPQCYIACMKVFFWQ